jgi:hypothetical protein
MPKIVFPPTSLIKNPDCVGLNDYLYIEFQFAGDFSHSDCDEYFDQPIPEGHYPPSEIGPFMAQQNVNNIMFYFHSDDGLDFEQKLDIKTTCP